MKTQRVTAAIIGLAIPLLVTQAQAGEIKVLASTAVKTVLEELGPQFEKAIGNKVALTFAPAAVLKTQIDQGVAFDVAILTVPITDGLARDGKLGLMNMQQRAKFLNGELNIASVPDQGTRISLSVTKP